MRPVNLLPARYRPRSGGTGDSKTSYIALGVLAVLVLAVFGYVTTANKVSSRNSEIAEAKQQLQTAQTQAVTLQGFGEFAGIKEARLSAVKSLATARTDWERLFRELAHVLPPQVWLTAFNSAAGDVDGGGELGPSIQLEGCAENHERIADTMVRLRELHVAEEVELVQSMAADKEAQATGFGAPAAGEASDESGCGAFYSFEISVAIAAPSPIAEDTPAPIPARLGGGG